MKLFCSITVPATYDDSWTGYTTGTTTGLVNILLSYLILDLTFYTNIFINLRTEVFDPNGKIL